MKLLAASLAVNAAVLASFEPIAAFFSLSTNSYPFVKLLNVAAFALAGALGLTFLLQTLHRISTVALDGSIGAPEGSQRPAEPRGSVRPQAVPTPQADETEGSAADAAGAAAESSTDAGRSGPKADAGQAGPTVKEGRPGSMLGEGRSGPTLESMASLGSLAVARAPGRGRLPGFPEAVGPLDMPSGDVLARHTRIVFRCWVVLFAVVGAQLGWVLRPFIGDPNLPFSWFRSRTSNFFADVFHALAALLSGS